MTIPLVQYPHCAACSAMNAACTAFGDSGEPKPSRVVMLRPDACFTGVMQERTGLPSIQTVQAPHWPLPQLRCRRIRRNAERPGQIDLAGTQANLAIANIGVDR